MKIGLLMVSPKAASVLMQGLSAGQNDGSVEANEALALEYELSKIAGHKAHHAPPAGQPADFIAEMYTSNEVKSLEEDKVQNIPCTCGLGMRAGTCKKCNKQGQSSRGFMIVWRSKSSSSPDHYLRIGKRGVRSTHKQERADLFTETEAHELALAHPMLKPKGRYHKAIVLRQGDKVGMVAVPKRKQPYMKHKLGFG